MCIGGPLDVVVVPRTVTELKDVLGILRTEQQAVFLLGNGSNLLIGDRGVRGWVISLSGTFRDVRAVSPTILSCGAGASLMSVARQASQNGLSGLEFAAGIPATLGGAVFMNAGAHGADIGERVRTVQVMLSSGEITTLHRTELPWRYRSAGIPSEAIVLSVELELVEGDRESIAAHCQANLDYRRTTQPLALPSAGSVFVNPSPSVSAGAILDRAGVKGYRYGAIEVSRLHANWIVNPDKKGVAVEVLEVIKHCQELALQKSDIHLVPEVQMWGIKLHESMRDDNKAVWEEGRNV